MITCDMEKASIILTLIDLIVNVLIIKHIPLTSGSLFSWSKICQPQSRAMELAVGKTGQMIFSVKRTGDFVGQVLVLLS